MATFGRELLIWFTRHDIFVFRLIVISVISHFGFEGWTLVLIASVSGVFLSFTFFLIQV